MPEGGPRGEGGVRVGEGEGNERWGAHREKASLLGPQAKSCVPEWTRRLGARRHGARANGRAEGGKLESSAGPGRGLIGGGRAQGSTRDFASGRDVAASASIQTEAT